MPCEVIQHNDNGACALVDHAENVVELLDGIGKRGVDEFLGRIFDGLQDAERREGVFRPLADAGKAHPPVLWRWTVMTYCTVCTLP